MVSDVQSWLDNPAGNFGWLVLGDESASPTSKRFDTRESTTPPVLTIEYTASNSDAYTDTWSNHTHRPEAEGERNK